MPYIYKKDNTIIVINFRKALLPNSSYVEYT